jgi:hypothetical protein
MIVLTSLLDVSSGTGGWGILEALQRLDLLT